MKRQAGSHPVNTRKMIPRKKLHWVPTPKLTNEIIAAAILGFEEQKRRIDTKIGELRAMLSATILMIVHTMASALFAATGASP